MKQLGSAKYFVGLPLLYLASNVFAAPPVNYNGWSATSGAIDTTVSCSTAGISCTTDVQDDGFLIETIYDANSDYTYMRFVVTDPTATGAPTGLDFAAETFIPFAFNNDGLSQGIASMQVIRETASGFESSAELQRSMMRFADPAMRSVGDAISYTDPDEMYSIKLSQTITDPDNGFVDSFDYMHYTEFATTFGNNPDSDNIIGRVMDISQKIDIGEAVDPAAKQQFFQQKRRMGVSGNIADIKNIPAWQNPINTGTYYYNPGNPLSTANNTTLGGTTVAWADSDEIVSNWLVQEQIMSDTSVLSHQTIENRTSGAFASQTSIAETMPVTPFAWEETNFGPTPTLP